MLTIAEIRRAAKALEAEDTGVSYSLLASKLGCDPTKLRFFVQARNGFAKELNLVADSFFPGLVYAAAVDKLRLRRESITRLNLARELKIGQSAVQMALRRHPERVKVLGIISQGEANLERRERMYADIIHGLFKSRVKFTVAEVGRRADLHKGAVHRDMRKIVGLTHFFFEC